MTINPNELFSVEDCTECIKNLEKQVDIIYDEKEAVQNKLNECLTTLHYVKQRQCALGYKNSMLNKNLKNNEN